MGQSRRVGDPATALLRDCLPKTCLDHGLIQLMLGYRFSRRRWFTKFPNSVRDGLLP